MIIFGTASRDKVRGSGAFFCPRCNVQRSYQLRSVEQYFSLYFIPLIPMGSRGRYVQCTSCGGTFAEEALHYNPDTERQQTLDRILRMMVMLLVAAKRTGPEQVARLQQGYAELTDIVLMEDDIRNQIARAEESDMDPLGYLRREADALNDEGKVILLRAGHDMLAGGGTVTASDQALLREIGGVLGMPSGHIDTVLSFGQDKRLT